MVSCVCLSVGVVCAFIFVVANVLGADPVVASSNGRADVTTFGAAAAAANAAAAVTAAVAISIPTAIPTPTSTPTTVRAAIPAPIPTNIQIKPGPMILTLVNCAQELVREPRGKVGRDPFLDCKAKLGVDLCFRTPILGHQDCRVEVS